MIILWAFVMVVSVHSEKAWVAIIACGASKYSVLTEHILSEPQNLNTDSILAVQLSWCSTDHDWLLHVNYIKSGLHSSQPAAMFQHVLIMISWHNAK